MLKDGELGRDRSPIEDLWTRTLSHVHSVLGRMEYLAHLRNPNSGVYEHHGLAMLFSHEEADQAMRESHSLVFQEWLGFDLERQKADLEYFISEQLTSRRTLVETWRRLQPYRNLIPASASEADISLFAGDLEFLLETIRNERGDAAPDPGDWRPL